MAAIIVTVICSRNASHPHTVSANNFRPVIFLERRHESTLHCKLEVLGMHRKMVH